MILYIEENKSIEIETGTHTIGVGIDDDANLCMSNDYNGDHAYVRLNGDQVRELIAMLQSALDELESDKDD